jgi:poly(hydroxyalkanoate) granule-associated protein
MAKKKGSKAEARESAQRIWFAGLGALSAAEEEGSKLFHDLVKRGEGYDKDLRAGIEKTTRKAREEVKKIRGQAGKAWDRIGAGLDDQVGLALGRMGVPTKKEIDALTRKVERLTKTLEDLKGTKKRPKKKAAKKKAAKKKAAKKKAGSKNKSSA